MSSPFTAADPSGWPEGPDADAELAELGFVVGPREVLCSDCHLLHPVGAECGW